MITDEQFDSAYTLFTENKLPVIINSSTHLSIYLFGKLFDYDTELDFTLPIDLWNNQIQGVQEDSVTGNGIIRLSDRLIPLTLIQFTELYGVINLLADLFIVIPKNLLLPFWRITYKGYELWQPNKPEELFSYFYTPNWRDEIGKVWRHGNIYIHAQSVDKAIERYEELYGKNKTTNP